MFKRHTGNDRLHLNKWLLRRSLICQTGVIRIPNVNHIAQTSDMIVYQAVGAQNTFQPDLAITTRRDSWLTAANNRLYPKRLYTEAQQQGYLCTRRATTLTTP